MLGLIGVVEDIIRLVFYHPGKSKICRPPRRGNSDPTNLIIMKIVDFQGNLSDLLFRHPVT